MVPLRGVGHLEIMQVAKMDRDGLACPGLGSHADDAQSSSLMRKDPGYRLTTSNSGISGSSIQGQVL